MNLSIKTRFLLAILTGVLLSISFPFIGGIVPLAFIAWVPLLLLEEDVYRKKQKSGKVYMYGLIAFFIYNFSTVWWIYYASFGGVVMAIVANSLLMAIPILFLHVSKKFLGARKGYIGFVFYWIGFEYLHFHWELSWPWLSLGNVFSNFYPLVQWYEYTGVLGGTLWILTLNLLIFIVARNIIFKKESWKIQTPIFILQGVVLLIPIIISLTSYYTWEEEGDELEVLIIQPNIDPYKKFTSIPPEVQIKKVIDLIDSQIDQSVDIVIAPETALPFSINEEGMEENGYVKALIDKVNEWNGPDLLIGSSTHKFFLEKNGYASRKVDGGWVETYNSALLISRNKPIQIYHKSRLVLGVERLPFPSLFEGFAIDLGGISGTLGVEEEPFCLKSKGLKITPCICYESIYGGYVAEFSKLESDFIAIITNDGWWKDTPGYKQHLSFASLRAIENRKYIARSANTGISAIVNSRGDILQKTAWWEEAVIRGTIRLSNEPTVFVIYGDIIGRVSAFTAILMLIYTLFKWLRSFGAKLPSEKKEEEV